MCVLFWCCFFGVLVFGGRVLVYCFVDVDCIGGSCVVFYGYVGDYVFVQVLCSRIDWDVVM